MQTHTVEIAGQQYVQFDSPDELIQNGADVLELLFGYDAKAMILHEHHLNPDFFELRTGVAGDIMQKFATYQVKAIILGDFSKYTSNALRDFIYESNIHKRVIFVESLDQARQLLG